MSLPALQKSPSNNDISITTNRLVREFNRQDRKAPIIGTDTGVTGAAYVIAPVPGVKMYEVGQEFVFKAVNANTGTAPTLAVNGLTAGTITYLDGSALVAGDIAANEWVEVIVASLTGTTPTFALNSIRPGMFLRSPLTTLTASLGADVALNNTANYFDGPSVAQGTSGTWFASGTVTCVDTVGLAGFLAKLWDGTTVIASAVGVSPTANAQVSISLSGRIINPAGNIRISVRDNSSTSGKIQFNQSGNSKDSTLTVERIG
jgi:hypothetical protein